MTFRPILLLLVVAAASAGLLDARTQPPADPLVVDSARSEMEAGRGWHAARLLEPLYRDGVLDPSERYLLARARAAYRDWPGVVEVLDGADWLDAVEGGAAWWILGRAREALDDPASAAAAYARVVERGVTPRGATTAAVTARLARARWAAGDTAAALQSLDRLADAPSLRSWAAHALVAGVVEAGRPRRVDELLARIDAAEVLDRLWDAPLRALLAAGDTAAAAEGYRALLAAEPALRGGRLARAQRVVGDAARSRGDREGAVRAYRAAAGTAATGTADGVAASRGLLGLGAALDASESLAVARHLDRGGDGDGALEAFDLHVEVVTRGGGQPEPSVRVERARWMATVPSRQEQAIREWRELSSDPDPDVGARALVLWAGLRRDQGRSADVQTLRRWLVERYPGTPDAASVVFFQGDAAHDRQEWDGAVEAYERVARMAPEVDYAGLARMRAGQIHLHRGAVDAALEVFEGYLADFPSGRRWEEATYWAARTRLERGDSAAGAAHLADLRAREPFSYYAVLTADLLGEPYALDLPPGPTPAPPAWVAPVLALLDDLTAAGLDEAAEAVTAAAVDRAESEGTDALLSLADGLNVRGRSLTAINLGWAARRLGLPWSERLVRIVYPFPYQELVHREAMEVGVDPLLLAALIRQESAFVADIVSSAGAVGLMQVMPATGRQLARAQGVENFTAETLESPEVNLHLGARFLVDQLERYGPELPLVLSAYNAGPARADRWRTFPEAADLLRLTERIPFSETRGYVKNVTRNRRLYEALYGATPTSTGR